MQVEPYRVRRWLRLTASALAGSSGLGLSVVGVELAGLAVVLLLEAIGVAELASAASTGELLGAVLVLVALGWFSLGAAWEGLLPFIPRPQEWRRDELGIAWVLGMIVTGVALTALGWATGLYGGAIWPGVYEAGLLTWSAGWAGLTVGVVAVGIIWALRRAWPQVRWWEQGRVAGILLVWAAATALIFRWAGGLTQL